MTLSPPIVGIQGYVQSNYSKLKDSTDAAVGQFKIAMPLPDDGSKGVIILSRSLSTFSVASEMLLKELAYLEYLRSCDFKSIKIPSSYGDIFEVQENEKKYPAIIVDWVPNGTLIDSKDPTAFKVLLVGVLMGIKVPTQQESWPMKLPSIMEKIVLMSDNQLQRAKTMANQIQKRISMFKNEILEKEIRIADMQIMISEVEDDIDLFLIDPLAVLVKSKNAQYFEDVLDLGKNAQENPDFSHFLSGSLSMLDSLIQWCQSVCDEEADIKKIFMESFTKPVTEVPIVKPKPDFNSIIPLSPAKFLLHRVGQSKHGAKRHGEKSKLKVVDSTVLMDKSNSNDNFGTPKTS